MKTRTEYEHDKKTGRLKWNISYDGKGDKKINGRENFEKDLTRLA